MELTHATVLVNVWTGSSRVKQFVVQLAIVDVMLPKSVLVPAANAQLMHSSQLAPLVLVFPTTAHAMSKIHVTPLANVLITSNQAPKYVALL